MLFMYYTQQMCLSFLSSIYVDCVFVIFTLFCGVLLLTCCSTSQQDDQGSKLKQRANRDTTVSMSHASNVQKSALGGEMEEEESPSTTTSQSRESVNDAESNNYNNSSSGSDNDDDFRSSPRFKSNILQPFRNFFSSTCLFFANFFRYCRSCLFFCSIKERSR